MKINRNRAKPIEEGDLTPMIDMTFQLIAFFMVLINFSQVERTEAITLPSSTLAKPPEEPPKFKILLNLEQNGDVIFFGSKYEFMEDEEEKYPDLVGILLREIRNAERGGTKVENIDVIIRRPSIRSF